MDFIEPNTQLFIEEFTKEDLNSLEHICVQFLAYKKDKPFTLKNPQSVEIRLDGVKFYKLHSFKENDFFEDDAMVYPIVVNDVPVREILVSAADIQEAMNQKAKVDRPNRRNHRAEFLRLERERMIGSRKGAVHGEVLLDQSSAESCCDDGRPFGLERVIR